MSISDLNGLRLGRIGELYAKINFLKENFEVLSPEVDDRGVDLIVKHLKSKQYYKIQVKTIRKFSYIYMQKERFELAKDLFLYVCLFLNNEENPKFLLIPSLSWKNKKEKYFNDRNYVDKKSKPEWGLSINKSNYDEIIESYNFEKQVSKIKYND